MSSTVANELVRSGIFCRFVHCSVDDVVVVSVVFLFVFSGVSIVFIVV